MKTIASTLLSSDDTNNHQELKTVIKPIISSYQQLVYLEKKLIHQIKNILQTVKQEVTEARNNFEKFGTLSSPPVFSIDPERISCLPSPLPAITTVTADQVKKKHPYISGYTNYTYVVLPNSKLLITPQYLDWEHAIATPCEEVSNRIDHPLLTQSQPILAAGYFTVFDGHITQIEIYSFHYSLTGSHLKRLVRRAFERENLQGDKIYSYQPYTPFLKGLLLDVIDDIIVNPKRYLTGLVIGAVGGNQSFNWALRAGIRHPFTLAIAAVGATTISYLATLINIEQFSQSSYIKLVNTIFANLPSTQKLYEKYKKIQEQILISAEERSKAATEGLILPIQEASLVNTESSLSISKESDQSRKSENRFVLEGARQWFIAQAESQVAFDHTNYSARLDAIFNKSSLTVKATTSIIPTVQKTFIEKTDKLNQPRIVEITSKTLASATRLVETNSIRKITPTLTSIRTVYSRIQDPVAFSVKSITPYSQGLFSATQSRHANAIRAAHDIREAFHL